MKRLRIKGVITVPTRRKVTQDVSINEKGNLNQPNEEHKNISDNICSTNSSQHCTENKSVEEEMQENVETDKQAENNDSVYNFNTQNHKSAQNSDEQKKNNVQSPERLNAVQINSVMKLTPNQCKFVKLLPKFNNNSRVRRNSTQVTTANEFENRKVSSTVTRCTKIDVMQSLQDVKDITTNSVNNNCKTPCVEQKEHTLSSEFAKKSAETRREFPSRYKHNSDKNKLKMRDLIYYNPTTNPMKKFKESTTATKIIPEYQSDSEEFEEESEEIASSAMPIPQVRVGPNGELIVDEQSLVIEQTNAMRRRKVLAKVIIEDDNNGNGFYKRHKKMKNWTNWETLKFYKVLSIVGTDFLLMQSLFPNRTRDELKSKFKKEEKMNKHLIEKVLAHRQEFDTEILKKLLDTFEDLEKVHSNTKLKQKRVKVRKLSRKRRRRIVAASIGEMDESDEEESEDQQNDEFDLDTMICKGIMEIRDIYHKVLKNENIEMHKTSKEANTSKRYLFS